MGLDGVEFVMEVEEEFGIRLGDRDWARLRTFGDLHAVVMKKLPRRLSASAPPTSSEAWEVIARIAAELTGVQPDKIRPDIRIADVMD